MKSLSGHRNLADPILADIQRVFASDYFERKKRRPSKVETATVAELRAEISALRRRERVRLLNSWSTPRPGKTGRRVRLSA